ncbi:MAG: hypothetical protein J6I73_05325 [Treponema sp.]|nr:hypothetical protein [Treponema sp.]
MLQFYFLSILLNLTTGMILVFGKNLITGEKAESANKASGILGENAFFDDKTFRLVLGVLTMFVGIMKLLSVVRNDIPVVGDLFPALAGFLGGGCLLIEYYKSNSAAELSLPHVINAVFIDKRKYAGYVSMMAAVLHFIFPDVLLL